MPIAWDENAPVDSDAYAGEAGALRSLKSTLATALANTFYWPGSGGGSAASAGQIPLGSARAFYGGTPVTLGSTSSTGVLLEVVGSGPAPDHFDVGRVYEIGSATTRMIGSNRALEGKLVPPTGTRGALSTGTVNTLGRAVFGITFGAVPTVLVTDVSGTNVTPVLTAVTTSYASVAVYAYDGSAGNSAGVHWMSLGTVAF